MARTRRFPKRDEGERQGLHKAYVDGRWVFYSDRSHRIKQERNHKTRASKAAKRLRVILA